MRQAAEPDDQPATVWWWVKSVVSWLLLIAMVGLLALTIVIPRITGSTPYTVLTGSMEPTYPPGTLIVVKPQAAETLGAGDAITFQWESGKPDVVTHRITAVQYTAGGERRFTTQGDANSSPDERPVVPEQIRGKVWYAVPYVGYINNYITGQQRSVLVLVVVGALLTYAVTMFVSSGRDKARRRGRQAPDTDDSAVTAVIPAVDADASTATK
ncbi:MULTISPECIES: signal peptidase I [Prescottella]|uniref:signal peptidase I n=1 Tax=Prescottella TaxID=2979332 RepID=UPI0007CD68AB|nr:signal peptidase I [Prescottella equi]GBF14336.1 signal peptidase I W [Rhodococcus sp. Br-6]MBM4468032.1 signal peptidase I [Prescottella equi]MBM4468800.1 signal peptidase I [Prescottella equi]MBM4468802.1 signal peptidase I [Prescottella equi]MBM4476067.1 signal peptidase I [Prescottella equi]